VGTAVQTGTGVTGVAMGKKRALKATESEEQIAVFDMARAFASRYPELLLLHAIPNGASRPITTAGRLKREGVKPGIPDMCLPVPRGQFHGLYIELKTISGRLSIDQTVWLRMLQQQGYKAEVCYGADQAINEIMRYLTTQ
jgi:hypothetical protein